jgi:hypothetical protein
MKLRTKKKIANAGRNGFQSFDSHITLELQPFNEVCANNNHSIEIAYKYVDDGGTDISPSNIPFTFATSEEINAFAEAIKALIPEGLSHTELFDYKVLMGAKIKMSESLNIALSEIEIVNE